MAEKITFSGARLLQFSRSGKKGGTARFRGIVNAHVLGKMDWPEPDERVSSSRPEGDLQARIIEVIPKDKELRKFEFTLDCQRVHGFEIVRRELEGKKGKGFRHELQFDVTFGDQLGCAKLEHFMLNAGLAKCGVIVSYEPKAQQEEIDLDGPRATEEQRQAVLEESVN